MRTACFTQIFLDKISTVCYSIVRAPLLRGRRKGSLVLGSYFLFFPEINTQLEDLLDEENRI